MRAWLEDFLANPPAADGCVVWPFSLNGSGYPTARWDGAPQTVGRIVLTHLVGPPPGPRMEAAHAPGVCHNRACVNPGHLRWATRLENVADTVRDGTSNRGERCATAKLTRPKVLAIYHAKGRPSDVAAEHGVPQSTVRHIKSGYTWSSVTGHRPKRAATVAIDRLAAS